MLSKNFLRKCFLVTLLLSAVTANAKNIEFCYEFTSDWGHPYYPKFTIDNKEYWDGYGHKLLCYDLESTGTTVSLTTNGFNMDYKQNVVSFNGNSCGFGTACVIPTEYQNEDLYYIHASVWPLDDKNLTGVLTAVYKPKVSS